MFVYSYLLFLSISSLSPSPVVSPCPFSTKPLLFNENSLRKGGEGFVCWFGFKGQEHRMVVGEELEKMRRSV